ncbi:MAG: hypothetical protein JST44_04840 [Cyanobacteria bacterium SZAS LIN-5]|nr:hypothetical protein [Cyanobacteria bacterium SZAS LIN-5]
MPENFCPDQVRRVDPIDQEATVISKFLQNGDRMAASARLREDLVSMGPTQFMALVGETKAIANATGAMTHIEITPLRNFCQPNAAPSAVEVSLQTTERDRWGRVVVEQDSVARIDNDERYQIPRPQPCEVPLPPVRCEPPPCEPPRYEPPRYEPPRYEPPRCEPPVRYPAPPIEFPCPPRVPPIEQPCPPRGGGINIDIGVVLKGIFGHKDDDHGYRRYEPTRRFDDRDNHSNGNRGDGNVIVNNYNTVNVRGGDAKADSNSGAKADAGSRNQNDNHNQRQDPRKNSDHHR